MKCVTILTLLLKLSAVLGFSVHQKSSLIKRLDSGAKRLQCISMESFEGDYMFKSSGVEDVCALYLIGLANQIVEIEFTDFSISCQDGGLLAYVDGWESQGQFFPGDADHPLAPELRYQTFCGDGKPRQIFMASQNVALLQFRIPTPGQGFGVHIRFLTNLQPCNAVLMASTGTHTLHNYGRALNCSLSIMNPTSVDLLNVDVGQSAEGLPALTSETGLIQQCNTLHRRSDYLELLDGDGLDPAYMWQQLDACGLASTPGDYEFQLGCQHSVVRLVSSGHFYNSATFSYRDLTADELLPLSDLSC